MHVRMPGGCGAWMTPPKKPPKKQQPFVYIKHSRCAGKYVFGDVIAPDLNTARTNMFFGGATIAGSQPQKASRIIFIDHSDDPWARASVQSELGPDLPFCLTTCDRILDSRRWPARPPARPLALSVFPGSAWSCIRGKATLFF